MRSLVTILAVLLTVSSALAKDTKVGDQLVCALSSGLKAQDKAIDIVREDLGNGSYTEFTTLDLIAGDIKLEATQIFDRITIEVQKISSSGEGTSILRLEGDKSVSASVNPDDVKNEVSVGCQVARKAKN